MVENPANTMSSELASAQAVDAQARTRLTGIADKGRDNPAALTPDEIKELCSTLLTFLDAPKS